MAHTAELTQQTGVEITHTLAETLDEEAFCSNGWLSARRLLDTRGLAAMIPPGWRTVSTSSDEIARLGAAGVGVAIVRVSNIGWDRDAKVDELLHAMSVGIAVDGSASNDALHMLAEVRQALLLARLARGAASMTVLDA